MKGLTIGASLLGIAVVGAGVAMAITNPPQEQYEVYATQRLTEYLGDNVCTKAPSFLGNVLQDQCNDVLSQNQAQIRELIANNTERQNYIILSIYKTDLSLDQFIPPALSSLVPSYHVETVGVLQQFHIYKAQERR